MDKNISVMLVKVSTHSHPKVAAQDKYDQTVQLAVSTHSHPKVAASAYGS